MHSWTLLFVSLCFLFSSVSSDGSDHLLKCGVLKVRSDQDGKPEQKNKWNKRHLTWHVNKYPSTPSREVIDRELQKSFNVWADVTPMTFTHEPNAIETDMKVDFDDTDGVLAYAYYPNSGHLRGYHRFNEKVDWSIDLKRGWNLYDTAIHETGHSLGLPHSPIKGSVMGERSRIPYNGNYSYGLDDSDIMNIQSLYGPNIKQTNELDGSKDCGCGRWCRRNNAFRYGKCLDGHNCHCWNEGTAENVICGCNDWCRKNKGADFGGKCGDGHTCICTKGQRKGGNLRFY